MKLNIAICDDDKAIINRLTKCLSSFQIEQDIDLYIETFQNGQALIERYRNPKDFDILFLDIEMPMENGIQIAKTIRSKIDRHVIIVFVSNYPKYMRDSFAVHPYHFITKPFTQKQIFELLNEIICDINSRHTLYTIVDADEHEETLNLRDILFFESIDSKKQLLCLHLHDRTIFTKGIIATWEKVLADYNFVVCHRGFLINLIHIHYFESNKIVLDNNETVPVSRALRKHLRDIYLNKVFVSQS